MSYTPTTWNTGDTITAAAMNKIEQGIAAGGGTNYDFVIQGAYSGGVLSATLETGSFTALYNKIQNQEPITGVYIRCGDTDCFNVQLSYIYYYGSLGTIEGYGLYCEGNMCKVFFSIDEEDSVTVSESRVQ